MVAQFKASDHCLLSILLERSNDEAEGDRSGIDELLAAMEALTADWLVPLGVSFLLVGCDPGNYFEEVGKPTCPHHFLRVDSAPADVRVDQAFADPVIHTVPEINAAVLRDEVARGLEQPVPTGLVTSLSELWWTSVRARSPIDDTIELIMPWPASTVSKVIDGERWCFGPTALAVAGPPARLRASNSHFATQLLLKCTGTSGESIRRAAHWSTLGSRVCSPAADGTLASCTRHRDAHPPRRGPPALAARPGSTLGSPR